jgi:hypothetical protein
VKQHRWLWGDGRFSWVLVVWVVLGTLFILVFDYYWRTNDTEFSRFW